LNTEKKKKPAALTPKTLKLIRKMGFNAAVTETWNPHVRIRQDLFGWMDILAYRPDAAPTVIGIQSTSYEHRRDRLLKMLSLKGFLEFCKAAEAWLCTWKKVKKQTRIIYEPIIDIITSRDFVVEYDEQGNLIEQVITDKLSLPYNVQLTAKRILSKPDSESV
jgi:hypothetical protein